MTTLTTVGQAADWLKEIKERAGSASRGPWDTYNQRADGCHYDICNIEGHIGSAEFSADGTFIAQARTDIPFLLGLITAQAADIERLTIEREEIIRVYERQLDDQRIELQTEIEGWQTERNVARGDQEAAEASLAAVKAERDAMREALHSIEIYESDTLSGRLDGPADTKWLREGVREIRRRARAALSLDAQGDK